MNVLIVATSSNNVIGKDNTMPWHLPEDLKHFKKTTDGQNIIMGRKTFESLGKALPNRTNIVITRQKNYTRTDAVIVNSLEEAIAYGDKNGKLNFIIGGAEIFELAIPLAEFIFLTRIDKVIEGDTYFPILPESWEVIETSEKMYSEKQQLNFNYITLQNYDL